MRMTITVARNSKTENMDMILTTQTDNCYTDLGLAEDISRTASAQRKSNHHTPSAQLLGDEKGFTQKYDILDKYGCKTITRVAECAHRCGQKFLDL